MTSAINTSFEVKAPALTLHNPASAKKSQTLTEFFSSQVKIGGLFGDFAGALKLSDFWTECVIGHTTLASNKMTEAGSLLKSYIGALELPGKITQIGLHYEGLQKGTVASVAEFANSVFAAGKSFFDGIELLGNRFGLLSKDVVKTFSPLSPIAGFSFAATELSLRTVPEFKTAETRNEKISSLMKLAKNVSLLVVGFFSLVATFFKALVPKWVILGLLTVYTVNQIAGRFFDGLIKNA